MYFESHESEPVSRRDLGGAHSADGGDLPEGQRAQSSVDRREVGVIENVVGRKTKFEALHFLDLNGLRKRHVEGDSSRPNDDVASGITEGAGGSDEGCGVEPAGDARIADLDGLPGHNVGAGGAPDAPARIGKAGGHS